MDQNILTYIVGGVALLVGIIAGKFIFAKNTQKRVDEADVQAKKIISDAETKAETIKQQKQLEGKERLLQLKAEHDKEVLERNRKLGESENRVRQKEQSINQKIDQLDRQVKENDA